MDLVLFGIQGSGKGTQSKMIAEKCGLDIFEAGGALRKISAEDSELGRKVKSIIEAGHLVPSEVVMEIVADFLRHLPEGTGALFDGIPRSKDQQEQFDALMEKEGREFKGLYIDLTEDQAMKRLTTRRICVKCKEVFPAYYEKDKCEKCGGDLITRSDDTPDAIKIRLSTFTEKTMPVIKDYENRGKILKVNGDLPISKVSTDIIEVLRPHFHVN
ncbi:nucleoside monophosphate kinase [Candidatus Peregrinibacteria bacterium]|nr:nucleoside monophosphate kinase [Candidatus Peregrinibacteria bacterium]